MSAVTLIDLTAEDEPPLGSCPVCGIDVPICELPDHCEAHFASGPDAQVAMELDGSGDVVCNVCGVSVPLYQLEAHEVAHELHQEVELSLLDDVAAAEDLQLRELQARYGFAPRERPAGTKCYICQAEGHWAPDCPQNRSNIEFQKRIVPQPTPSAVAASQRPDPQWGSAADAASGQGSQLHRLLTECLLRQRPAPGAVKVSAVLCGPVGHFGGQTFDSGWGCGYRNIQMQLCHALMHWPQAHAALFGGAGYVPDIPSLQAWIECAWRAGFDPAGAEQLGGSVQGTKKWIGTTEAATLLRYFGLPARIVDFGVDQQAGTSTSGARPIETSSVNGHGAQGGVHPGVECDACGVCPIVGMRWQSQILPNFDLCPACHGKPEVRDPSGPFWSIPPPNGAATACSVGESLTRWVWRYFQADAANAAPGNESKTVLATGPLDRYLSTNSALENGSFNGNAGPAAALSSPGASCHRQATTIGYATLEVIATQLPPLYLQHEGHSRTVVGIERREFRGGQAPEYSLLVFDPGVPPQKLRAALAAGQGWQKMVRRGVHTLRQGQFQVLHVPLEPGKAVAAVGSVAYEASKVIAAAERY